MRSILVVFLLLSFPLFTYSHPKIDTLSKQYKKTRRIHFRIFVDDKMLIGEECRLVIRNDGLKGPVKTYEEYIQSGDFIDVPKGAWTLDLFYKYGFTEYKATLMIKKKKEWVVIRIDSWSQMENVSHLVGNLNISEKVNLGNVEALAKKYNSERFDFFGLPVKGSFAEKDKSFLVNWLIDKPYWGRIWYATRLPFIIEKNNKAEFNHEVLMKLDPKKVMSFYYHPADNRLIDTFVMKGLNDKFKSIYKDKRYYYPYLASSLVFDTLAGVEYTGLDLDITNEMDLKIWYCLLNLGYPTPAICTNVHSIKDNSKVYNFIPMKNGTKIIDKYESIRNGRLIMSTGIAMVVTIGDALAGDSLVASKESHQLTIKVRSNPSKWDLIDSVEIIRNGKVVKKFTSKIDQNAFNGQFSPVFEEDYAWYVVKVKTKTGKMAISNPIYFLPLGYERPKPLVSIIKLKAINAKGDELVNSKITVMNGKKKLFESFTKAGLIDLQVPLTATIRIEKQGYVSQTVKVAALLNVDVFLSKLTTVLEGGNSALADKKTYDALKKQCLTALHYAKLKKIKE